MISAVGVVIPAHDEQDLLPSCLAAVRLAARQVSVPVHVVVVADACTDRTAELARAQGAIVVEACARSVGAARRAGVRQVLRSARHLDPATLWIATTDADTLVPPCWLSRQLRYASQGWKGVVGTVTVEDWSGHPPRVRRRYTRHYRARQEHHPHVHGANLGFAADAFDEHVRRDRQPLGQPVVDVVGQVFHLARAGVVVKRHPGGDDEVVRGRGAW